jgi:hypothetical protein
VHTLFVGCGNHGGATLLPMATAGTVAGPQPRSGGEFEELDSRGHACMRRQVAAEVRERAGGAGRVDAAVCS